MVRAAISLQSDNENPDIAKETVDSSKGYFSYSSPTITFFYKMQEETLNAFGMVIDFTKCWVNELHLDKCKHASFKG